MEGRWLPPAALFRGRPIFGKHRVFVPERSHAERLWAVLGIKPPSVEDCTDVLEEIAGNGPSPSDEAVLIDTYRHVAAESGRLSKALRARLAALPIWTGEEWTGARPVFAVANSALEQALGESLPVWRRPCALDTLGELPATLGVTVLHESDFTVLGVGAAADVAGEELASTYRSAVGHLRDYLARSDPRLHDAGAAGVGWQALSAATVAVAPHLGLQIEIQGQATIDIAVRAHVVREPLIVCFSDTSAAADHEAGGGSIASYSAILSNCPLITKRLLWHGAWPGNGRRWGRPPKASISRRILPTRCWNRSMKSWARSSLRGADESKWIAAPNRDRPRDRGRH